MSNEINVGLWSTYQQPQQKPQQKRMTLKQIYRSRYHKPLELGIFEMDYYLWEYSKLKNIPEFARVKTNFRDDTANELTRAILAHLKYTGNFGARVNSTGIYDSKTGKYRYSNGAAGMADISAVIAGKPVQIEIKAGKDKPRAAQLKVQAQYRAAGGMYEFVHNFHEYAELYKRLTGKSSILNDR